MPIVDEQGRLFGKVNLLDLVIVLVVLAVAARFGYQRFAGQAAAPAGQDTTVELTVKLAEQPQATIDALPVGAQVYESKSNTLMGTIIEAKQEPALIVRRGDDGNLYEYRSKETFDYFITISGPGRVSSNSVTMSGLEVKVGRMNFLNTAMWAGVGPTWSINTR